MTRTLYVPGTEETDLKKVIMSLMQMSGLVAISREVMTADRTYYVATTGSDSNDGLSSGAPFLTIAKAMSVAGAIDCLSYQLTISVAAGTYSVSVSLPRVLAALPPILTGVGSTTIISTTGDCVTNNEGTPWAVQNLKVTSSAGFGLVGRNGGIITFQGIEFGACTAGYHIVSFVFSTITCTGNYTISGGAISHIVASNYVDVSQVTVTLTGTPAFSGAFAYAFAGAIRAFSTTFSGGATGPRYLAEANGVINTAGGGANYFPGNSAGSTATGGQYI